MQITGATSQIESLEMPTKIKLQPKIFHKQKCADNLEALAIELQNKRKGTGI